MSDSTVPSASAPVPFCEVGDTVRVLPTSEFSWVEPGTETVITLSFPERGVYITRIEGVEYSLYEHEIEKVN